MPTLVQSNLTNIPGHCTKTADFGRYTDVSSEEWLEGTVVSIMNYGAFVRLDGDVDGMVHISQLDPHGERVDSVYNSVEASLCVCCCF